MYFGNDSLSGPQWVGETERFSLFGLRQNAAAVVAALDNPRLSITRCEAGFDPEKGWQDCRDEAWAVKAGTGEYLQPGGTFGPHGDREKFVTYGTARDAAELNPTERLLEIESEFYLFHPGCVTYIVTGKVPAEFAQ